VRYPCVPLKVRKREKTHGINDQGGAV
jgi:hypothetical protein